jgi:NADPH:quinone reductase-like Zn-dependent oxidoreductase
MAANHAVVVDHSAPGHLSIREVAPPVPSSSEAQVRVEAFSLNRGETRRAVKAVDGWRPGWDLAGVVTQPAADGSGPAVGARVVGLLRSQAWSESVAVPTNALAELSDAVTFVQAAALPVAGLTALLALTRCGDLAGKRICVTGATGGVGDFALQLARLAGAEVIAQVRRPGQQAAVTRIGADGVIVGDATRAFEGHGPYNLVLESVGGQCLTAAMATLAEDGVCVSLGGSDSFEATCDFRRFRQTGRTTLYGFMLFKELELEPASLGLAHLVGLVADGRLEPTITVEAPWSEIGTVVRRFLDREFAGKAVLRVAPEAAWTLS